MFHAEVIKYRLAVAHLRRGDEPLKLAHAVRHLGDAYHRKGQSADAAPCYAEALAIYRTHPQARPLDLANAIRSSAVLESDEGRAESAQRLWQEAYDLYVACGVQAGVAESSARLALLAAQPGQEARSREWLGRAISAADAASDAETLQYVREVRARLERTPPRP
jgi:tetratricopeptide (TPR) repeat protein